MIAVDDSVHKLVMSQPVPQKLAERLTKEMLTEPTLSKREVDVLALYACGFRVMEISEKLYVTPNTINSYVARIRDKLQARTIAQCVAVALTAGYLPADLIQDD